MIRRGRGTSPMGPSMIPRWPHAVLWDDQGGSPGWGTRLGGVTREDPSGGGSPWVRSQGGSLGRGIALGELTRVDSSGGASRLGGPQEKVPRVRSRVRCVDKRASYRWAITSCEPARAGLSLEGATSLAWALALSRPSDHRPRPIIRPVPQRVPAIATCPGVVVPSPTPTCSRAAPRRAGSGGWYYDSRSRQRLLAAQVCL